MEHNASSKFESLPSNPSVVGWYLGWLADNVSYSRLLILASIGFTFLLGPILRGLPRGRPLQLFVLCTGLLQAIVGLGVTVDVASLLVPIALLGIANTRRDRRRWLSWLPLLVLAHLVACHWRRSQLSPQNVQILSADDHYKEFALRRTIMDLLFGRPSHQEPYRKAHMKIFLKLVELSWELQQDVPKRARSDHSLPQCSCSQSKERTAFSSALSITSYLMFPPTMFVGYHLPYQEFYTWSQPMHSVSCALSTSSNLVPISIPNYLASAIGWLASGIFLRQLLPRTQLRTLHTDYKSFIMRNTMLCLVSFTMRAQYYGIWRLADTAILSTGAASMDNVDPWVIERATDPRAFWAGWNRTTQKFMKNFVYRRIPPSLQGLTGVFITFLVCGVWHGIRPGYFAWAVTSTLVTCCWTICRRSFGAPLRGLIAKQGLVPKLVISAFRFWLNQCIISFVTIPVMTDSVTECLALLSTTRFCGFIAIFVTVLF